MWVVPLWLPKSRNSTDIFVWPRNTPIIEKCPLFWICAIKRRSAIVLENRGFCFKAVISPLIRVQLKCECYHCDFQSLVILKIFLFGLETPPLLRNAYFSESVQKKRRSAIVLENRGFCFKVVISPLIRVQFKCEWYHCDCQSLVTLLISLFGLETPPLLRNAHFSESVQ